MEFDLSERETTWDVIERDLPPVEIDFVKQTLGSSLIQELIDLKSEFSALVSIFGDLSPAPQASLFSQVILPQPPQPPQPPAGGAAEGGAGGRRRPSFARLPAGRLVVEELRAAVTLANRIATERGVSIENLLSERERAVVEQVAPASLAGLNSSGAGAAEPAGSVQAPLSPTTVPSRPSTANSTSRPSTAASRPSSSSTASHHPLAVAAGSTTLTALTHSKSRLSGVKSLLERDRELLLADVAYITALIDDHLATPEPPSLSEVRAVSGKLREVVEGVERMDVMVKVESKAFAVLEPGATPTRKPPTSKKIPNLPMPPPAAANHTSLSARPNSAQRLRQEVKSVREGKMVV